MQWVPKLTHTSPAPFSREHQLNKSLHEIALGDCNENDQPLPGHPCISLGNIPRLIAFLEAELWCKELEQMAPHLWMMSLHSSANISPLHRQIVKGREIVVTEDPLLHLVWLPQRIHIKPLPAYLLSFTFWNQYLLQPTSPLPLGSRDRILRSALGYLRTYSYLICHESDFFIAQKSQLIPSSISWAEFCVFISRFDTIADSDVSKRYTFGELRLTRLNVYCKLFLGRMRLHRLPATTYSAYFSRFKTPSLFIFAMLSVVLNAVQVGLAAEPLTPSKWPGLWIMGRVFMVLTLSFSLVLILFLCVLFVIRFGSEWRHAICDEIGRRAIKKATEKSSQASEAV